ncbi:hypothetical protein [uncultured Selenomonas sp.]|uniref:hypothetical protein n=1 Tax=uncultured Selenomonas sp. TaxID=159275 RepID=UPI0028D217C7|nr:hypothetical protein [uncultured Selenomonas sp.]
MREKICALALTFVLVLTSIGTAFAAEPPNDVQSKLALIEQDTYGREQTGALIDRINRLERDYDGAHRSGSLMSRIDAIYDEIYTNSTSPSILMDLNAIEWNISHETSMRAVQDRVNEMEMALLGKTGEGTFKKRITALSVASFGKKEIPVTPVSVPANTLIKVALVTPVNAKNLKVGDTIEYQVADDVFVNDALVFTKGSRGEGTVTKVRQSRNFGRNAEVEIDFKNTKALDGTYVTTFIGEEAKKEMQHLAMAAGASLAGIAVLGPLGVVAGAFVHGKNVDLPAGTELYIQTKDETTLYGVQTTYDSAAPFQAAAASSSHDENNDTSVYDDEV